MSGEHHILVTPNAARLKALLDQLRTKERMTVGDWAGELGINPATATKLLAGQPVRPLILGRVAQCLGLQPDALVSKPPSNDIPDNYREVTAMKYGWFIEGRRSAGAPTSWSWESEVIRLRRGGQNSRVLRNGYMLKGSIENSLHGKFHVIVQRLSSSHLALWAQATKKKDHSFAASFTEYFPDEQVLGGVWCGMNNFCHPAVHRMYLSVSKLSQKRLISLAESVRHEVVLKINE